MSRGINSSVKAALAGDSFRIANLMRFDFSSVLRITDYGTSVTSVTLGTFTPSSHLINFDNISETSALRGNKFSIELSGVDQSYVSILLGSSQIGRRFRAWRAVLDENNAIIGLPFMVFDGIIVGFSISDSSTTSSVSVEIASHWTDFEKTSGRKTNANSQNAFFPNDRGMDFSSTTVKEIKWGRK